MKTRLHSEGEADDAKRMSIYSLEVIFALWNNYIIKRSKDVWKRRVSAFIFFLFPAFSKDIIVSSMFVLSHIWNCLPSVCSDEEQGFFVWYGIARVLHDARASHIRIQVGSRRMNEPSSYTLFKLQICIEERSARSRQTYLQVSNDRNERRSAICWHIE